MERITSPIPEVAAEKVAFELVKYPDKRLLTSTRLVSFNTDEDRQTLNEVVEHMTKVMRQGFGWGHVAGLSANQLGYDLRLCYCLGQFFVNPSITWQTKAKTHYKEGCYSLEKDKFDYPVWRSQSIIVAWQDLEGQSHEGRFNGKHAQVLQHEIDHLDGITCVNHPL